MSSINKSLTWIALQGSDHTLRHLQAEEAPPADMLSTDAIGWIRVQRNDTPNRRDILEGAG